jgi:photosystem II stability/assembly factor-like uncharacterized protein
MTAIRVALIGLASVAWLQADTPPIHSFAIAPGTPPVVYAGTGCAGVFKSADGGATWVAANHGLTRKKVDALVIDPAAPLTILAGAGSLAPRDADIDVYSFTIFRSTDGGATWVETLDTKRRQLEKPAIEALVFDPVRSGTVHVLFNLTYMKSIDGGSSWRVPSRRIRDELTRNAPISAVRALAFDPLSPTVMFLVASSEYFSGNDLFRGEAGGKWRELYSNLPGVPGVLVADPVKPSTLYAGEQMWIPSTGPHDGGPPRRPKNLNEHDTVIEGRKFGRLFKSTDGGVNWVILKKGLPSEGISAFAIHPSNSNILYATGLLGVFKSIDAGASWNPVSNGLVDVRAIAIAIDPASPDTLFLGTDYGAFKSTDGAATWKPINQGFSGCTLHNPSANVPL